MTPTFCWVFLLALVGRATSVPRPLVVDACALLCNPGAETESEQERDKVLFPRYPKVNCKLQSNSDDHQAWIIASHCFKLCNDELSIASEVNCFALRSSLQANLGCYCEALTPLSPNTMRLHESWRLNFLVKELASDILDVILESPLDTIILCEIHQELFKNVKLSGGKLVDSCQSLNDSRESERKGKLLQPPTSKEEVPHAEELKQVTEIEIDEEIETESKSEIDKREIKEAEEILKKLSDEERNKLITLINEGKLKNIPYKSENSNQKPPLSEDMLQEYTKICKTICMSEDGDKLCPCKDGQPHLEKSEKLELEK